MSLQWEQLIKNDTENTSRLKVHGGWVLKERVIGRNEEMDLVFIPDPDHDWDPKSPEVK